MTRRRLAAASPDSAHSRLNHVIRKVDAKGVVTTFAGSGKAGYAEGYGSDAIFNTPYGITATAEGLYIADTGNHRVRLLSYEDAKTTLFAGNGLPGFTNGPAPSASLNVPLSVAVAKNGDVYIADSGNERVRRVTRGMATSFAGNGSCAFADGRGDAAAFCGPVALAFDASGSLLVVDCDNNQVRKISPLAIVSTLVGSGEPAFADGAGRAAAFAYPSGVAVDVASGTVFVSDRENHRIRTIDGATGVVQTLAGSDADGSQDGLGADAVFSAPYGMAFDPAGDALYVADRGAHVVRKLSRRSWAVAQSGQKTR